jgi:hypothetical protein
MHSGTIGEFHCKDQGRAVEGLKSIATNAVNFYYLGSLPWGAWLVDSSASCPVTLNKSHGY